jgi:nicotinamidase-related amidase
MSLASEDPRGVDALQWHGLPVTAASPSPAAVERSEVALVLIDVINPLEFDGGARLLRAALPAARALAGLKAELQRQGVPAIYVNDNFGCWNLGLRELVARQLRSRSRGRPIIELLAPRDGDHLVLKPKHSGFYGTSLEPLLEHLGARRLVLAGFAANICVWITASDAHMRGYQLIVPSDCVASETARDTAYALEQMRRVARADTRPAAELCATGSIVGLRPARPARPEAP